MKKLLFLAGLLACSARLAAQSSLWQISGYIRNESGEALPGALVQVNDSTGVFTNEKGQYLLRQAQRPNELAVRRLGYFSQRIVLHAAEFQQQKRQLDITLSAQDAPLPEVDIVAQKRAVVAEEKGRQYIYDYEFAGENLLLLLRERRQHLLRLVTESGEVLSQMELPDRFFQLYQSCAGGLHLVGEKSAHELILNALHIDTFPRYPIQKFRQIIEPCVLHHHGHYFYRRSEQINQALRYWHYDQQGQYRPFAYIRSASGLREAWKAYTSFLYGKSMVPRPNEIDVPPPPPVDQDFDLMGKEWPTSSPQLPARTESLIRLAQTDDQISWLGSLQRIQLDSLCAPLMVVNDTLLLFDYPNATLRRFGPDFRQIAELPTAYAHKEGWQKELLKDLADHTVYAHFAPKGRHYLAAIDVRTGQTRSEWPLPEVPYISHTFRVRNGFLYYLGRPQGDVPTQILYKLSIRQQSRGGR